MIKQLSLILCALLLASCGQTNSFYWSPNEADNVFTNEVVGYYDYAGRYRSKDTPLEFYFGPFASPRTLKHSR